MIDIELVFRVECDHCDAQAEHEELLGDATRPDVDIFEGRAKKAFINDGWNFDNADLCPDCADREKEQTP